MADLQDCGPALTIQADTGRVMERRAGIEELDAQAGGRQPDYRLAEHLGDQSAIVHWDVYDSCLIRREGAQGAHVGRALGENHVAGVDEDSSEEVECLLGPHRYHNLVRMCPDALQGHHLADALTQPGITLT